MSVGTETRQRRRELKQYRCFVKARKRKKMFAKEKTGVKSFKGFGMVDFREHQVKMAQETMVKEARKVKGCAIPGCQAKHHAKGFCAKHYKQIKRNGKVNGD